MSLKRKPTTITLTEAEMQELLHTANNEGVSHQTPGTQQTDETPQYGTESENKRERRYEDD